MAVTKMMHLKQSSHLYNSLVYILEPSKTGGGLWVGGNSGNEPEEVYNHFMRTKKIYEKLDGRKAYHYVISFAPGEVDEEKAYKVIQDFCEAFLGDHYDYVFAIHNDHAHIHGHISFNSVSRTSGYKYQYRKGDWEKHIQPITDMVCRKHGLKELSYEKERVGRHYAEHLAEKRGRPTWKTIIKDDINYAASRASDFSEYLQEMKKLGYTLRMGNSRYEGEYITYYAPGSEKGRRDFRLGEEYKIAGIKKKIAQVELAYRPNYTPTLNRARVMSFARTQRKLSRYQVRKVGNLFRLANFRTLSRYDKKSHQVRRELLKVDKLQEECRYIIRNHIRAPTAMKERLAVVLDQERLLKEKERNLKAILGEPEASRYKSLVRLLEGVSREDDQAEEVIDALEALEKKVSYDLLLDNLAEVQNQLKDVRKEKAIVRRLSKDGEENKVREVLITPVLERR
ncbi:relaxase/mobilization nuclease domain-containing protein [Ohessyouella blattaphilus]|uniref:relaxase/mobilization nuclease domain-containing protein n=1 Tax=Ohessyouella blattaphilus TaxID=2949333 RepID=UPI003E2DDF40